MAESNDNQKRVTIALGFVNCNQSQDKRGSDMLCVAGGAVTGPRSGSKSMAVLTTPVPLSSDDGNEFDSAESVIFDNNIYIDDFIELGLQFRRASDDYSNNYFAANRSAVLSALTADIGTALDSLSTSVEYAVSGAVLSATSLALAKAPAFNEHGVLGVVQKRLNVADYPDDNSGPCIWKFADRCPANSDGLRWSEYDYEIEYTIEVGPAR
ncbi:hypothetical protein ABGB18_36425 [Nonomuraea sp. B12E4]|uniref:hypothetical protein n=1 Tax=Nonomuraea sp. B12E4 TaxID=3153564 RepID=UPI00325DCFBC